MVSENIVNNGLGNGSMLDRHQAITWSYADLLSVRS